MDVSIVICTYNSKLEKTLSTIRSLMNQEGITSEIIISDDGSKEDNFVKIREFFSNNSYSNYKLIKNEFNVGTVKNYLSAVKVAEGKYIYGIGPGDLISDRSCLKDFFNFCENNHHKVCFGKAVYYTNNNGDIQIIKNRKAAPPNSSDYKYPHIYSGDYYVFSLIYRGGILGTTFFRDKEYALEYISKVSTVAKYVEDNTSAIYGIFDGIIPVYYDRIISYYEFGTGISTQNSEIWNERMSEDFYNTYRIILKEYGENAIIRSAMVNLRGGSRIKRIFKIAWINPIILFRIAKSKMMKSERICYSNEDLKKIKSYIGEFGYVKG